MFHRFIQTDKLGITCFTSFSSKVKVNYHLFRRVRKISEKRLLASPCLSVRLHETTQLPLDGFSWNLIFAYSSKTCRENSSLINPLALELDIYSLAHHLCKKWIFHDPRRVALGNNTTFCWGINEDNERKSKKNNKMYLLTKYIKRVLWARSGTSVLYIGCRVPKRLKSDKNNGYVTWRPTHIFDHISLIYL